MNNNTDFFIENARFLPLIKYYAKKIKDVETENDLISFLYLLFCRKEKPPNDKYIAVCIRNEYIRLSKNKFVFAPFVDIKGDNYIDLDLKIDIKNAFLGLTEKEKRVIFLHFYCGYSIENIAEKSLVSRQNINKIKNNALNKMRKIICF